MQEPIFSPTISKKLYNERAVLIAAFLGGPLAAGFLVAQNFKAIDEPQKATRTWLIATGVLILLIITSYIPFLDKVPPILYSAAICTTAHFLTKKYQGSQIQYHQESGGQLYSTWRAVAIGLISLAIIVIAVLVFLYFATPGL